MRHSGWVLLPVCLFLVWTGLISAEQVRISSVYYHDKGSSVQLTSLPDSLTASAISLLTSCDLRYRLSVSDSLIKSMVKSASCLELVFTEAWTVRTLEPPLYRIDRILIPFDGLYATDTSSAAAVIFLGNGTYFSGPLGNSSGLPLRAKLHKSLAPYLLKRID